MNKEQLVESIAKRSKLTKKSVQACLDGFIGSVTQALSKGEKLTLVGFGTFQVRERKSRTGRNPRTGESIQVPAMRVPKFRAAKALKEAVK